MQNASQVFTMAVLVAVIMVGGVSAQTTAFTFQGTLNNASAPATGNYDFEFLLFDTLGGGAPVGATLPRNAVAVANGIFTVSLDFGAQFPGANRFLEIRVRQTGGGAFTTLTPRQQVVSSPHAVQSLNAATATNSTQLGGVAAANYLQTTGNGSGLTNLNAGNVTTGTLPVARGGTGLTAAGASGNFLRSNGTTWTSARILGNDLPANSDAYVQNQNVDPQVSSNFNISGFGDANTFNARVQFNLAGNRILGNAGTNNLFVGIGTGTVNTGGFNTFVGPGAGTNNAAGANNSFFGFSAGAANTTGTNNSFFGHSAGAANTSNNNLSFFGQAAGASNTSGTNNSFFGQAAGGLNTSGSSNSFFGKSAGAANVNGGGNSFFGDSAGAANTGGAANSFFGRSAGAGNQTGNNNSFFGHSAGLANTTGSGNTFFGRSAGIANDVGFNNAFFGHEAGVANTSGSANTFIGIDAGDANTTGLANTMVGFSADVLSPGLSNASAFGFRAAVSADHSIVLGAINGVNGSEGNTKVGIGTTAPVTNLHVQDGGLASGRIQVGSLNANGDPKIITFGDAGCGGPCVYIGEAGTDDLMVFRATEYRFQNGPVRIDNIGTGGSVGLCRSGSLIADCSSSLRYKKNIAPFADGLSFINRLSPVSFDWKTDGMKDIGFGAEDVAKINPRFVTYNAKGEVEGVKYDRFSVLFVNAFKEQQQQIDEQRALIERQQSELAALKALVCSQNTTAAICQPKE